MNRERMIKLVQRALTDIVTFEEINQAMAECSRSDEAVVKQALLNLQHFVTDEDIRSRDKDYNLTSRFQLERALELLKQIGH